LEDEDDQIRNWPKSYRTIDGKRCLWFQDYGRRKSD